MSRIYLLLQRPERSQCLSSLSLCNKRPQDLAARSNTDRLAQLLWARKAVALARGLTGGRGPPAAGPGGSSSELAHVAVAGSLSFPPRGHFPWAACQVSSRRGSRLVQSE